MINYSDGNFLGRNPEKIVRKDDTAQRRSDLLKQVRESAENEIQNRMPPTKELFNEWDIVRKDVNKKLQAKKNQEAKAE